MIQLDKSDDIEANYYNQSIEDIAEDVQGVDMPQKSRRYLEMMDAAEDYYAKLHEIKKSSKSDLSILKRRLDELKIPFSNDAAFSAFLKFERDTVMGNGSVGK